MAAEAGLPAAKALTHRETMLIVLGVLLPVFMGSLDGTILASALPSIGRELGEVHNLPWLITAYLIANTTATTLYGKISDIHGRRTTLIISISMYMLGSLVCGLLLGALGYCLTMLYWRGWVGRQWRRRTQR